MEILDQFSTEGKLEKSFPSLQVSINEHPRNHLLVFVVDLILVDLGLPRLDIENDADKEYFRIGVAGKMIPKKDRELLCNDLQK